MEQTILQAHFPSLTINQINKPQFSASTNIIFILSFFFYFHNNFRLLKESMKNSPKEFTPILYSSRLQFIFLCFAQAHLFIVKQENTTLINKIIMQLKVKKGYSCFLDINYSTRHYNPKKANSKSYTYRYANITNIEVQCFSQKKKRVYIVLLRSKCDTSKDQLL